MSSNAFDAQFLQLASYIPKSAVKKIEKWHASALFEVWRDKEFQFKREYNKNNEFGLIPANQKPRAMLSAKTNSTLFDWVILLAQGRIELHKCSGLRNLPLKATQVEIARVISISPSVQQML
jgi:hypothetical protein